MKKIKGHLWSPSDPSVPTNSRSALAVGFGALDPEGSLAGNEQH